jgi:hypothetical protein
VHIIKDTALSATTLQNYLACPAKFYYSTVQGLKAEEEVAESLDYGMFGTIFHETMRLLYSSEDGRTPLKFVTRDYIETWLSRDSEIKALVKSLIMKEMNAMDVSGRNLGVADVIVNYVKKTLSRDLDLLVEKGRSHFVILDLEGKVPGEFMGQKFKGYIDRLDSLDEGEVTREPSCEEKGAKVYKCMTEGCNHEETEELNSLGHAYGTAYIVDQKATCEEPGRKSKHCTSSL